MSTLLRPKDSESYHSDGKDTSMSKEYIQVKPRRELNFIRQKNKYTAEITLINTNYDPVIFKVRTTASKSYVVSPTIGLIHPRATTIIQIFMPTKEEIRDRANDKFLVQAFPYAGDIEEEDQIQEIFNLFAKSMSSQGFQNTKLKVHFEVNSAIKEVHSEESTPVVKQKSRSSSLMRNNNDFTAYHNNKDDSQPTSLYEEIEIYNKSRLLSSPDPKGSYPEQGSNQLSLKDIGSKNILTSSPEQGPTISANPSLDNIPKSDLRNNNLNNSMANMKQTWKTSSEKEDSRYLSYISAPRMRTGAGSSDVSGFTDFTDFKSSKGDTNTLLMYKAKCLTLEQKYRQQKKLLAQMTEEKESYLSKTNALKLASIAGPKDDHEFKHVSKGGQIELWHILVVSIIFLILGSLLK